MARRLASLVCARSLKAHRPAVSEGPPFGGEGKPRKRVAEDQALVLDRLTLSLAVEVRS